MRKKRGGRREDKKKENIDKIRENREKKTG